LLVLFKIKDREFGGFGDSVATTTNPGKIPI